MLVRAERPLVAEKNNPTPPPGGELPPPPGTRWATQEEIQRFLARARRVLFLYYMPVASKMIH
jgi:hypothetical protein